MDVDKESNPVSLAIFLFLVIAMKYILQLSRHKLMSIRLLHLSCVKSNNKAHRRIFRIFMRGSNRNFNIPPPLRANPGHLTTSCARGVGNLTFTWVGSGKFNQKCQASSDFLFRAPKSLIAINTCLDEMEEFKGRDRTFVSDWLTKKGLQKL